MGAGPRLLLSYAGVMELVDVADSKSAGGDTVWVRAPPPVPRRSKVRFAPTSFYAYGKKDVIRPLPCSSFPNRTRCAGLRFDFGWKPGSIGIYTVVIFQLVANDISLCDEFFHFIAKLIARSFCCSSLPNRTRCRWAPVWGRRFAAVLSDLEKYRF